MYGLDISISENVLGGVNQFVVGGSAGIGLIALHDPRPLVLAHGIGTGVSEEIDVAVLSP